MGGRKKVSMRLWHQNILSLLPNQQLNGQHRECAALRGNGWGKKHATVDYVFEYDRKKLYQYHLLVIAERDRRGYKTDPLWRNPNYRGKLCEADSGCESVQKQDGIVYCDHDENYLNTYLENLRGKGITLTER